MFAHRMNNTLPEYIGQLPHICGSQSLLTTSDQYIAPGGAGLYLPGSTAPVPSPSSCINL